MIGFRNRWKKTALQLGLTIREQPFRLTQQIAGAEVLVVPFWRGAEVRIEGLPRSLSLTPRKLLSSHTLRTGDKAFDEAVAAHSVDPRRLRGLLDARTRARVRRVVEDGGRVSGGTLEASVRDTKPGPLFDLVDLAVSLVRPSDTVELLAATWRTETNLDAALYQLAELIDARAHDVVQEALAHPNGELRLMAARAVGTDGDPVLAEVYLDRGERLEVRLEALRELQLVSKVELTAVLHAGLLDPDGRIVAATLALVADRQLLELLPQVRPLAASPDLQVATVAISTLAELEDAEAEPVLVPLLAHWDEPARQQAAVTALGVVGTVKAVESLHQLTSLSTRFSSLHRAATDAIRQIQARLTDAEAGRLSVAPHVTGELSLATAAESAGALSKT